MNTIFIEKMRLERRMQPKSMNQRLKKRRSSKGIQKKYEDYHHVHYTDGGHRRVAPFKPLHLRSLPARRHWLAWSWAPVINPTQPRDPVIDQRLIEAENLVLQATREEDLKKQPARDQIAKYKETASTCHWSGNPVISENDWTHRWTKTNIPVGDLKDKEQSPIDQSGLIWKPMWSVKMMCCDKLRVSFDAIVSA